MPQPALTPTSEKMQSAASNRESRCPANRKAKGIFYTPARLSHLLSDWAIRSTSDRVLEPSFGGCVFISAVVDKLSKLACKEPHGSIFGFDIDEAAFSSLQKLLATVPPPTQFFKKDFLSVKSQILKLKVDVVIGNPPYVSRHNMNDRQREIVDAFVPEAIDKCPKAASLWAYFIIHSISFLNEGGRMALVLPGSLLNSQYGRLTLESLPQHFSKIVVISIRQRLFVEEGTDESTTILLCEGKAPSANGNIQIREVLDLPSLAVALKTPHAFESSTSIESRKYRFFQDAALLDKFLRLSDMAVVKRLGDVARISIGVVTGANDFFVVNKSTAHANGLSISDFPRILSKFRFAKGIQLSRSDVKDICAIDERCVLLRAFRIPKNGPLRQYLYKMPKENRRDNKTFAKRKRWFLPGTEKIPDAFFPYMHHLGPQMVLNEARINCTNTIHRVFFKDSADETQKKAIAISLLTSFSQLSAEMMGRSYGSGVLKHEPSEAMKIEIILPRDLDRKLVKQVFAQIDKHLRTGSATEATKMANKFLAETTRIPDLLQTLEMMEDIIARMRQSRAPAKIKIN